MFQRQNLLSFFVFIHLVIWGFYAGANPRCSSGRADGQFCTNCGTESSSSIDRNRRGLARASGSGENIKVTVFESLATDRGVKINRDLHESHFGFEDSLAGDLPTFDVQPSRKRQKMEGFGAAMTESCALNLLKLDSTKRQQALTALFSKMKGAGLDVIRVPMGSSDFADMEKGNYSYDDTVDNKPDPQFKFFSMERDEKSFELIREARKINPHLRLMISPWSAPAWMKSPQTLKGGTLHPNHYQDYANYFVQVLQGYQKRGLPVEALTVQNEPEYPNPDYPSMELTWQQQATFVREYLGPTLQKAGLRTQILVNDHNWECAEDSVNKLLDDPQTKKFVSGVAYHCYSGKHSQMLSSISRHPDVPTFQTECSGTLKTESKSYFHWWMETQSLGAVKMGTNGAIGWNLCLDERGGPKNNGCSECRGLITIDFSRSVPQLIKNPELDALAQVSRFIQPGSHRIEIEDSKNSRLQAVGFTNPDGKVVFVAHNPTEKTVKFRVRDEDCRVLVHTLAANSAVTMTWVSRPNEIALNR